MITEGTISTTKLTIYTKTTCSYCDTAKKYLRDHGISFVEINIETNQLARDFLKEKGHKTVPQIYLNNRLLVEGGATGLMKLSPENIYMLMMDGQYSQLKNFEL